MGIIKPFFLGFVIVTIGCHVGLRTIGRHAGRRPLDDQRRGRRVGRRADRGLLRDAAVDLDPVLMRAKSHRRLRTAGRARRGARAGRAVRQGQPVVRREGDSARRDVLGARRAHQDLSRRQRRGEVDDPEVDAGPVEARLRHDLGARAPRRPDERGAADGRPPSHGHGVPGRRAVRFVHGRRERRLQALRRDHACRSTRSAQRVEEVLGFVGLEQHIDKLPSALVGRAAPPRRDRARDGRASRRCCSTTRRRPASIR